MDISEQIRIYRKKAGLSQKELGKKLGVSQQHIAQYETGKRIPKIETLDKIASALNVSIADIKEDITWDGHKNTSEVERMNKEVSAIDGLISILNEIYGKIKPRTAVSKYGAEIYYIVGEEGNQFILHPNDIVTLYDSVKAAIPSIIENLKTADPKMKL